LRHPAIVTFFGIYISPEADYHLCTEFMPLGDLSAFLCLHTELTTSDLIEFCLQALTGLQYLEANKIIHRDIAARNLLVEGDKGDWKVKVTDFGMARFVDKGFYVSSGKFKPVRWCSPEVLQFNKYSFKSDVWAFGITMWEIFAKAIPFDTQSNEEVAKKIVEENYRLDKPALCPESVYLVMLSTWNMAEEKRPSFAQLHESLSKLKESTS
jgi:serine/threonine protein kinase